LSGGEITEWENSGESWNDLLSSTDQETPVAFDLSEPYPNPFNPVTTFQFSLPEEALVQLNVYNVGGRKISTLIDGLRQAGIHQISFDGSHLSSGIYVYRLETGSYTQTGKLVLMK
jgi:hypothetical protein